MLYDKAKRVYEANKEIFEEFWAKNPEFRNHVPMPVLRWEKRLSFLTKQHLE